MVLTHDEVRALLTELEGASAERLLECCRLRVKDVGCNQIPVRRGKA